ncbi:MAG: IS66 family insertion sequence element accessory protein TnpB [Betaproteobacteria bacterium]|nr:IS66 family insertion sequence element accessory protein TnpB [Betaproteobacteria bacterium]
MWYATDVLPRRPSPGTCLWLPGRHAQILRWSLRPDAPGTRPGPLNGRLFVFINRRATQMKVLYWDRTGFCVWAKRLEQGRFLSDWRRVTTREMDWTGLKLLLEGIEAKVVKKRYRRPSGADACGIIRG